MARVDAEGYLNKKKKVYVYYLCSKHSRNLLTVVKINFTKLLYE